MSSDFVDLHCHGGANVSFDDVVEADIAPALDVHRQHGTGTHVLSLITAPLDIMEARIAAAAQYASTHADVAGLHLEGPFISPLHKGAHDPQALVDPKPEHVQRLLNAGVVGGKQWIKHITIAPELNGGLEAVAQIRDAGVVPALGHTDANYAQALAAFEAGVTHITHAFNAMNPIHHRAPGPLLAAQDAIKRGIPISVEAIADGVHMSWPVMRLLFEMFPRKICLVTDAMSAAGAKDGSYMLGSLPVTVENGTAKITGTDTIAGSTLFMDTAVQNCIANGIPEAEVTHAACFGGSVL